MRRGELIGERFEIDEHVASGGTGRVFRARDVPTGRTAGRLGSVGQQLGERGSGQDALGPDVDLLDGRRRDALLDVGVHGAAEAPPQLAQQYRAFKLPATLLAAPSWEAR